MAYPNNKDFSFVKNRQPQANNKVEQNFFVWQNSAVGFEVPPETAKNEAVERRLSNRGNL